MVDYPCSKPSCVFYASDVNVYQAMLEIYVRWRLMNASPHPVRMEQSVRTMSTATHVHASLPTPDSNVKLVSHQIEPELTLFTI